MGRVLLWGTVLLGSGLLAWFLLGEARAPGAYDPLAPDAQAPAEEATGPGLKTREAQPLAAEVEPFEGGDASVWGVVTDEDGVPLSGLQVAAQPRPKGESSTVLRNRRAALALFQPPRLPGKAVAHATTDANGLFRIEGLKAGDPYRVAAVVSAPHYTSSQTITASRYLTYRRHVLVGTGSALRGRVVDAEGKGVQAWVSPSRQGSLGHKLYVRASWRPAPFPTDADGRFTLAAVPDGTLLFTVTVQGRGSRSNIPVDTPTEGEVELAFEDPSGATVQGRVVDTAGRGIAGAKVSVRSRPERPGGFSSTTMRAATTDEHGAFAVQRLTPGIIQSVQVFAEGYVSPGTMGYGMPLSESQPTQLEIILARGAVLEGRVLDPTGQPISGATVQAARVAVGYQRSTQALVTATSDAEGAYRLLDVPLGPGELKGKAEGYYQPPQEGQSAPYPWMPPPTGVAYDAQEEGQTLRKDIELARGRTIRGTVKDEEDQPAAGVRVSVSIAQGGWYWGFQDQSKPVVTGPDGTFVYEGLAPDKTYTVTAVSDTHLADPVKVAVPKDADPEPIEIKLERGGTVTGRVLEADGKPAPGATVTCNYGNRRGVARLDGTFEITGIKAGAWTIQVSNLSPLPASAKRAVTVVAGEVLDGIELTLPVTLAIRGTVADLDGKVVPGLSVRAQKLDAKGRQRGRSFHATTDTQGAFELEGLASGDYAVWSGSNRESPVAAGTEGLRLTHEEPERITVEGRVLDPSGKPVVRGSLRIWYGPPDKRNSQATASITGGAFRARLVTDETEVDVEVTQALDAAGRPINFLPDRKKDFYVGEPIELRLDLGQEIRGRVLDGRGAGLVGLQVSANPKGQRRWGWYGYGGQHKARTDEEGHWVLKGLKEGEYEVSVTPGGEWITPPKRTVEAGTHDLEFKLLKGVPISGKVLDPDGTPLANANVWLAETPASKAARGAKKGGYDWSASMRLRAKTGTDGSFTVKGLPEDGLFHVSAGGNGAEQPFISDTVRDVPAGTKDVTVQLGFGLLIQGKVVGPDGEAVTRGSVYAQPAPGQTGLGSANTNLGRTNNRFKLGPLKPGRYKIRVQVQGKQYANPPTREVDAGATGLVFECPPATILTGRIDADDVKGFMVHFRGAQGHVTSSRVNDDGTFTIRNASDETGTLFTHRVGDDRYGELADVERHGGPYVLTLRKGKAISGWITNLPLEMRRRPQVYARGENVWIQARTEKDGSFVITGLPPGKYGVQGWMSGGSIAPLKDVAAGTHDVVLEFRPK